MKQENTIRAADNQTINGIALTIRTIDGKEKTLTLDQLMQMAGFEKTDKLNQVQFSTEKDGYKLVADANLDPNYPGFNIDGYNGDKLFWLPMRTMTGRFSSSPVMASVKKLSLAMRTSSIRPIAPTGVLEPTLTLPVRSTPRLMRSLILAPPGAHLMTMTATKRMLSFETTTATTSTWWFLWML